MTSIYPIQKRGVDPFAEYNSNAVNIMTRAITGGRNCISSYNKIDVTFDTTSSVIVSSGTCFKDDVLISFTDNFKVNLKDYSFYFSEPAFNQTGYYYIVIDYTYVKSKPAPQAAIKILKPSERSEYNENRFILLKVLSVSNGEYEPKLDNILDYDPEFINNKKIFTTIELSTYATLPTFNTKYISQIIYITSEDKFYFGKKDGWWSPGDYAYQDLSNVTLESLLNKGLASSDMTNVDFSVLQSKGIAASDLSNVTLETLLNKGLAASDLSNVRLSDLILKGLALADLSNVNLDSIFSRGVAKSDLSNIDMDALFNKGIASIDLSNTNIDERFKSMREEIAIANLQYYNYEPALDVYENPGMINSICDDGTCYYAVGNTNGNALNVTKSRNGKKWYPIIINNTLKINLNKVLYSNNKYIITANNGYVFTSSDSSTWITTQIKPDVNFNDIGYANGNYILIGYDSTANTSYVTSSSDLLTWTQASCTFNNIIPNSFAYSSQLNKYIIVGSDTTNTSVILTSSNLSDWVIDTNPSTRIENCIIKDIISIDSTSNYGFIACATSNTVTNTNIFYSTDATNWTITNIEFSNPHTILKSTRNYILIGSSIGNKKSIAISVNNIEWTHKVNPRLDIEFNCGYWDGERLVIGGKYISNNKIVFLNSMTL